jgi:hypothetical protein
MSYLQKQMSMLKFDKRLTELNYKSGILTPEEYQKHIESLPDRSSQASQIQLKSDGDAAQPNGADRGAQPTASEPTQQSPAIPINADPFGSGY